MPRVEPRETLDLLRTEAATIDKLLKDLQGQAQSRQMYDAIIHLRDRIKADMRLIECGEVPSHLLDVYFGKNQDGAH